MTCVDAMRSGLFAGVAGAALLGGCVGSPPGRAVAEVEPGFSHVRVGVRLAEVYERGWTGGQVAKRNSSLTLLTKGIEPIRN